METLNTASLKDLIGRYPDKLVTCRFIRSGSHVYYATLDEQMGHRAIASEAKLSKDQINDAGFINIRTDYLILSIIGDSSSLGMVLEEEPRQQTLETISSSIDTTDFPVRIRRE